MLLNFCLLCPLHFSSRLGTCNGCITYAADKMYTTSSVVEILDMPESFFLYCFETPFFLFIYFSFFREVNIKIPKSRGKGKGVQGERGRGRVRRETAKSPQKD